MTCHKIPILSDLTRDCRSKDIFWERFMRVKSGSEDRKLISTIYQAPCQACYRCCIIQYSQHSVRQLLLPLFYRQKNCGYEMLSHLQNSESNKVMLLFKPRVDCIGFPPYYPNFQTERSSIEEKFSVFILFKKQNSDPNSDHDVTEDFMKICLLYCFYFF